MATTPIIAPVVPAEGQVNVILDSKTLEQCLKTVSSFGQTTYHNLCTGVQYDLPWGTVDWALCLFLLACGISVLGAIIAVFYLMVSDF